MKRLEFPSIEVLSEKGENIYKIFSLRSKYYSLCVFGGCEIIKYQLINGNHSKHLTCPNKLRYSDESSQVARDVLLKTYTEI